MWLTDKKKTYNESSEYYQPTSETVEVNDLKHVKFSDNTNNLICIIHKATTTTKAKLRLLKTNSYIKKFIQTNDLVEFLQL